MGHASYSLSFEAFKRLASEGNLIPLYREILAGFETPVSAFTKIDHGPSAYLFESVEGGEKWARYSFLGSGSTVLLQEDKGAIVMTNGSIIERFPASQQPGETPLDRVRQVMARYRP